MSSKLTRSPAGYIFRGIVGRSFIADAVSSLPQPTARPLVALKSPDSLRETQLGRQTEFPATLGRSAPLHRNVAETCIILHRLGKGLAPNPFTPRETPTGVYSLLHQGIWVVNRKRQLGLLVGRTGAVSCWNCLLYTSDAADDLLCVDLG